MLAVSQGSLGDVLHTGPALRALATSGRPLTVLCAPGGADAARILPGVDDLLVHPAPWFEADVPLRAGACRLLVEAISCRQPEEAVVFTAPEQSPLPIALLLRLAGVPRVVTATPRLDAMPAIARAVALAQSAGYRLPPNDDGRLRVDVPAPPRELPEGKFVAVHTASPRPRVWEPRAWSALVDLLLEEGNRVVVTGPAPIGAGFRGPQIVDFAGRCDFPRLASIFAGATAVAASDSSTEHLAAAVGTPAASPGRPWLTGWDPVAFAGAVQRLVAEADAADREHQGLAA